MGLKSGSESPKPVQILLQRLSFLLSSNKEVVQLGEFDPIGIELFPEQFGELRKGSDVAIREPTEPLYHCTCEGAHKHLAPHCISSSRNNHLGVKRRKMVGAKCSCRLTSLPVDLK